MSSEALVTVLVITYNHVKSFDAAMESILAQKTNFGVKIIVLDDASKDGTSELVRKYERYSNVKCIIRENNLGSVMNVYEGLKLVDTKYFAMLDSDDYWCDENKLQTQVDILESNPDCSFCGHNTLVKYHNQNKTKLFINSPTRKFTFPKRHISRRSYLEPHTSSRLFRTECLDLTEFDNPVIYAYDLACNFYFMTKGNLYYIDKVMSVYNFDNKGVYTSVSAFKQRFNSAFVVYQVNTEFKYKYNDLLSRHFAVKLNLSPLKYFGLRFTKNPERLTKLYEKVIETYKKNYLTDYEEKPILKLKVPFRKGRRLVLEIKREKDRV